MATNNATFAKAMEHLQDMNKFFGGLNAEQKELLRLQNITAEKSPQEWITLLQPLAEYDAKTDKVVPILEKYAKRFQYLALGVPAVVTAALLIFPRFQDYIFFYPSSAWALMLLGALPLLLVGFLLKRTRKFDLNNGMRVVLIKLLAIFQNEIQDDTLLHLQLNFGNPAKRKYKIKTEKNYLISPRKVRDISFLIALFFLLFQPVGFFWGVSRDILESSAQIILIFGGFFVFMLIFGFVFYKDSGYAKNKGYIRDTFYKVSWLILQAKLSDDSLLYIELTSQVMQRKVVKKKVNFRGKIKMKTKQKAKSIMTYWIKVALDKEKYALKNPEAYPNKKSKNPNQNQPKLKANDKRNTFALKFKEKYSGDTNNHNLQKLLQAMKQIYDKVQVSSQN